MGESSSFLDQRNEAFREVHPGPTKNDFSVKVDESVYREAMTLKDIQRENERTVDDLFKPQDEIGSVFETRDKKLEEKVLSHEKNEVKPTSNNNNNGIDSNAVDTLKRELSDQHKTIQHSSVGSNFGL